MARKIVGKSLIKGTCDMLDVRLIARKITGQDICRAAIDKRGTQERTRLYVDRLRSALYKIME